jgi:hypothetical protein
VFDSRLALSFRPQHSGMKKYIREIMNDVKKPEPPVPADLDNQILSKDPAERVRQLDQQAQENEERESSS